MTVRAVCIGLFLSVAINLIMLYNDYFLGNTPLILNHMPTVGMSTLLFLIVFGAATRKAGMKIAFSQGELLLIWAMIGVAGGIGATGFGRAVPGFAASAAYMTTASNDYATYLLPNIPDWMVVSKDPDSKALRWYFEGLPREKGIPWGEWLVPMAAWSLFVIFLYAVMFAFCSLFYRQWAHRERLTFPIVYLPLEMTQEPAEGRLFNDFLRNPVVWMGAAIPILFFAVSGLNSFMPSAPKIPNVWPTWGLFPDRPWSEFNLGYAALYFPIVGLTFLLTTEVSFSIWFFFLLYRLSFVYVAWMGAAGTGFFGQWQVNVEVFQTAGAVFAVAFFLFWTARRSLAAWLKRVVSGATDAVEDMLPARLTFALLLGGLAGIVVWVMLAGVPWWATLIGMGLFVCVILVLSRLVVEAGLLLIGTEAIAYEFVKGLFPAAWVTGPTIGTLSQFRGALMSDVRELLLPYLMNGVRSCSRAMLDGRKLLGIFALTIVVALGATIYGRIATAYKYGGAHGDLAYNGGWNRTMHESAVNFLKKPPNYEFVKIGDINIIPVTVMHMVVGVGLTAFMLLMRAQFLWWPLNPLGYIMCASWPITEIWFSVFLGWVAKAGVMKFGGAMAYRRFLPFFLGLVLGHAIIATFWMIVSLVLGRPGVYSMLPH